MLVIFRVKGLIYPSVTQTFTVLEPRLLTWIDFFPDPGHCLNKLFFIKFGKQNVRYFVY